MKTLYCRTLSTDEIVIYISLEIWSLACIGSTLSPIVFWHSFLALYHSWQFNNYMKYTLLGTPW